MEAARKWIVNRQILPGYPTDRDWNSVNRRSVTVALYRLAGAPQVELPAVSPYTDITPDDPDYTAIIWARQRGITFGWVDGRFGPLHGCVPLQVSAIPGGGVAKLTDVSFTTEA